mgnify:CR=1 FL=1
MGRDIFSAVTVGERVLEWSTLQKTKEGLRSLGTGRVDLPPKIPPALGTEEKGGERMAALRAACSRLKPPVVVGLPAQQVLLRVVRLPSVDEAELAGMVELQVDKFSPFPVETVVFSHEVLAQEKENSLVLIAAARENFVEDYGRELQALGLLPARVDVAELGWWQLLADAGEIKPQGRHLILLISDTAPVLMVFQNGVPVLFRVLEGVGTLRESPAHEDLAGEVAHTLMALELEHGIEANCALSVWHPAEQDPGPLVKCLQERIRHEVALRVLANLPPVTEGLARRLATGRGVDLTPRSWKAAAETRRFRRRLLLSVVAMFAVWLAMVSMVFAGVAYERFKLTRLEKKFATLHGQALEVREMRRRVGMIKRYTDRRGSVLECLREISANLPSGVELSSLTFRKGKSVKISGVSERVEQVYQFKSALDNSKIFQGAVLKGVQERGGRQFFDMELKPIGSAE